MESRDVGMFLVAMDRIALAAGVSEIVYVTHVGKSDARSDGDESALGAERWESAADAIWVKGNEKDSGVRWFRAEGRGVAVSETNLHFDSATWAETLDAPTAGKGRRAAVTDRLMEDIVRVVGENPGINKGDLGASPEIKGDSGTIKSAIEAAANKGLIKMVPGSHNSKTYFPV